MLSKTDMIDNEIIEAFDLKKTYYVKLLLRYKDGEKFVIKSFTEDTFRQLVNEDVSDESIAFLCSTTKKNAQKWRAKNKVYRSLVYRSDVMVRSYEKECINKKEYKEGKISFEEYELRREKLMENLDDIKYSVGCHLI